MGESVCVHGHQARRESGKRGHARGKNMGDDCAGQGGYCTGRVMDIRVERNGCGSCYKR